MNLFKREFNFRNQVASICILCVVACSSSVKAQFSHWEKDIQHFEHLDSIEVYDEDAILFTGSSSIRLWSTIKEDMVPYKIIQRGYGGAKLDDYLYYSKRIIYPHTFKAIVIFIANDISGAEDDKTPVEVQQLFAELVEIIREKYTKIPIFWIEITPTNSRWKVWPEVSKANQLIKEICDDLENVYFIATSHASLSNEGKPKSELFVDDQLHLNREGYRIWSGIIKDAIERNTDI
ncbi:GDSL-type esterase/lipase family protein [Bacteroidota bacterium]